MTKHLLFAFLCILLMNSCKKDEFKISEVDLLVSSEMAMAMDVTGGEERLYIRVKEIGKDWEYWLNIYGIVGFEYEVGYEYVLRVKKKVVKDPLPDLPNVEYTLISVTSKTLKNQ